MRVNPISIKLPGIGHLLNLKIFSQLFLHLIRLVESCWVNKVTRSWAFTLEITKLHSTQTKQSKKPFKTALPVPPPQWSRPSPSQQLFDDVDDDLLRLRLLLSPLKALDSPLSMIFCFLSPSFLVSRHFIINPVRGSFYTRWITRRRPRWWLDCALQLSDANWTELNDSWAGQWWYV